MLRAIKNSKIRIMAGQLVIINDYSTTNGKILGLFGFSIVLIVIMPTRRELYDYYAVLGKTKKGAVRPDS